jgi:hypothetical protein
MASDGQPVQIPGVSLVHGSQAPKVNLQSGKVLPPGGKAATTAVAVAPQAEVASLNKFLNDSGRAAQFRVDPNSGDKVIQEINPSNGEVVAEYSAAEFAELARSLGISGALVDDHA